MVLRHQKLALLEVEVEEACLSGTGALVGVFGLLSSSGVFLYTFLLFALFYYFS